MLDASSVSPAGRKRRFGSPHSLRSLSPRLAEDFKRELRHVIVQAAANPLRFHPAGGYRRANLKRFPYHILYDVFGDTLRIMIVRHNKRHPRYGAQRR